MVRSRGQGYCYLLAVTPEVTPPPPPPVRYLLIAVIGLEEYLRDTVTPFPQNDRPFDRKLDLLTIMTIFLT
jgi:hypothetical protein